MSAADAPVQLEIDGELAVLSLNRPEFFNAIDLPLLATLQAGLDAVGADTRVRVALLQGRGRAFCGGGDIGAMQRHAESLPAFVAEVIDAFHRCILSMARLRVPVVAAVHGAAAGGGFSLALAADLVVAARSARFVVAYPQLGTSSDGGLTFRLQQRLGPSRALALLARDTPLSAEDALAAGLVDELADDEALASQARATAARLAALPPVALAELKALLQAPSLAALEAQLGREREAFVRCAATAEFRSRVAAFAARSAARSTAPAPRA